MKQKLNLECSACGYGATGHTLPERCPMCQTEGAWIHKPWRPWTRERHGLVATRV